MASSHWCAGRAGRRSQAGASAGRSPGWSRSAAAKSLHVHQETMCRQTVPFSGCEGPSGLAGADCWDVLVVLGQYLARAVQAGTLYSSDVGQQSR